MKILGIALVGVGVGMAFWGYQLSGTVGARLTHAVTGSYTDRVMWYYMIGGASLIIGIILAAKK